MDYKKELLKLLNYCIENRNYLKASESQPDRTAADAYQDIRNKIHEIFEREPESNKIQFQNEKAI